MRSKANAPNPEGQSGNLTYLLPVTEDNEGEYSDRIWSHTLVISMVRSTKITLHITDIAVLYSFFGNVGGAYTLLTLVYGLLYSVKTPEVETEFALPGILAIKWLLACATSHGKFCRVSCFGRSKVGQVSKPPTCTADWASVRGCCWFLCAQHSTRSCKLAQS